MEVPVTATKEASKEAAKMDTDETGADVNMQDAAAAGVENGMPPPESEDKPVQMETDAKVCIMNYCLLMLSQYELICCMFLSKCVISLGSMIL